MTKVTIGSGNNLALSRWQANTLTHTDLLLIEPSIRNLIKIKS